MRTLGRVFARSMRGAARQPPASRGHRRLPARYGWAIALLLGLGARVNHHLGGPQWATAVLITAAVVVAVVLLVRRIAAATRRRR
ncbi:hypothetical protein GCM10022377_02000 [Zhihengliuella alba]|uniref:DUF2631 domain-containing protein n=1 Tax=Zhihengliuella alba TaxID=547018 RepID=A0ABP7CQY7_9MICC